MKLSVKGILGSVRSAFSTSKGEKYTQATDTKEKVLHLLEQFGGPEWDRLMSADYISNDTDADFIAVARSAEHGGNIVAKAFGDKGVVLTQDAKNIWSNGLTNDEKGVANGVFMRKMIQEVEAERSQQPIDFGALQKHLDNM